MHRIGSLNMATTWEYTRVNASAEKEHPLAGDHEKATGEALAFWLRQLNERGAEGWELVSERFASGGGGAGSFWVEYSGTMKRPRAAE